jgi:hypothetical protein
MSNIKKKSLKGKTLCFYFHRHNCYEICSEQCSLFMLNVLDKQYDGLEQKALPTHCRWINDNIMYSLDKKYFPLYIYKSKCGHYSMGSGQHRLCIAGQLGLEIPVIIREGGNSNCTYCETNGESGVLKSF